MKKTPFKPGQIIHVRFPFTNLETNKQRPALVVNSVAMTSKVSILTVAMVTSQLDGIKIPGDVKLQNWEKSGLLHESLVRLAKLASLESELIRKSLGRLSTDDFERVQSEFKAFYSYWI